MLQNLKELADVIENSMATIMTNRSFRDIGFGTNHPQLGAQVLASIAGVLDEYVNFNLTPTSALCM